MDDVSQGGPVLTLSSAGLAFIARQEGFRAAVYQDSAGNPTIGYGHLLAGDEHYPDGITRQEAVRLLSQDIAEAEAAVRGDVTVALNQSQFDALVSFAYNAGAGAFCRSTLLRYVNARQFDLAGNELLRWNKVQQQGILVPESGLTNRRCAEKTLFLNGEYGAG